MIVKTKDFIGDNFVPNVELVAPGEGTTGNKELLQYTIDKYEDRALLTVLGFDLKKELVEQFDADGNLKPGVDDKWIDLVNGKDDYLGLIEPLVNYIYFYFLESQQSQSTGVGEIKTNPKGGRLTSSRRKAVKAWRRFYELIQGNTLGPTTVTNSYGFGVVWEQNEYELYKPLYQFLHENKDLFPNARPMRIKNMNLYGL